MENQAFQDEQLNVQVASTDLIHYGGEYTQSRRADSKIQDLGECQTSYNHAQRKLCHST